MQNIYCGRILRGTKERDFRTLSDDPSRKIVMLIGDDGLERLRRLSPYEQLLEIGYQPKYISELIERGNTFKFITFPQESSRALLATWENVIPILNRPYPRTTALVARHLWEFRRTPFEALEIMAGFNFSEVRKAGPEHPKYMTEERFLQSEGSVIDARAFLYFTLHMRELYSGDGYTKRSDGSRGIKEFFLENSPVNRIPHTQITDLRVVLP